MIKKYHDHPFNPNQKEDIMLCYYPATFSNLCKRIIHESLIKYYYVRLSRAGKRLFKERISSAHLSISLFHSIQ